MRKSCDRVAWLLMAAWMLNVWTTDRVARLLDHMMPIDSLFDPSDLTPLRSARMMVMLAPVEAESLCDERREATESLEVNVINGFAGFVIDLDDDDFPADSMSKDIAKIDTPKNRQRTRLFVPFDAEDFALAAKSKSFQTPLRLQRMAPHFLYKVPVEPVLCSDG